MRPFGLRGRMLVAFVATSMVTLAAAAAALLSPLQQRLRTQNADALQATVLSARPQLNAALRRDGRERRPPQFGDTAGVLFDLADRINARVLLYHPTDGAAPLFSTQTGVSDRTDDVYAVFTPAVRHTVVSQAADEARIASPLDAGYVLAARKPNTDVVRAVDEVRNAFITAAAIGLGAALVFALVLSTTLSRRLARLRRSALRIMRDGMDAPAPVDTSRDEVGDLARAMAAMQAGLRRQEAARRRFVATASHELRTPLTSLSGTLELLAEDLAAGDADQADAHAQVSGAQRELRRLRNLATELLDLSRLDAGVALRSEPVELGEVARAVAAEFALQARETGRALEIVPPRGPCWARGDPEAVARVARILIDNALRYAPAGAQVRIGAEYHGETATLVVADDGPGVHASEREVIFERFQRGTTTGAEAGFGLGLAIGRELAERLDGALELAVDDEAGPGGARFVLILPIELPAGSHAEPEPAASA